MNARCSAICVAFAATLLAGGCGGSSTSGGERAGRGPGADRRGGPPSEGRERTHAAVPVEVAQVERRDISSYIETNGSLEAENEVDVVARTSAPIVELAVEEGDAVRRGQLLARLDELEYRAQMEIARVALHETDLAFARAKTLQGEELISPETFEQAQAAYETAEAQYKASRILLGYTEIRAPFDGRIVTRYVQPAQQVATNAALFRISDFDPLLCPIQVPERELPRLRPGQSAYITVEPYPQERFDASVLRISPVIDAATGTLKVTLEVNARDMLRPGMFARVYVETETRPGALVMPKTALSLESIGDTVYVVNDSLAERRQVTLGFTEGDFVEALAGVAEGEAVVVVGQDALSDGTPVQILAGSSPAADPTAAAPSAPAAPVPGATGRGRPPGGGSRDLSQATPEQLERVRERMRQRGMSEEQIEERIRRARSGDR